MIFKLIIEESIKFFGVAYRWLEQYVINYFVNFGRGFEQALILLAVIAFTLIMVFILIKHAKKLPTYYVIEIVDVLGRNIMLEDLRLNFSTYDVAKSYSQFYDMLYGGRYRFRVRGYSSSHENVNSYGSQCYKNRKSMR
jgi:hypothetical protein